MTSQQHTTSHIAVTVPDGVTPAPTPPADVTDRAYAAYSQALLDGLPGTDAPVDGAAANRAAVAQATAYAYQAGQAAAAAQALARFSAAYARSGQSFTPDELADEETAEIAAKAERTLRQYQDAFHTDMWDTMPDPLISLQDLLAVLAGTRAAFGFSHTLTGREIVARMREEDQVTVAADPLRLHLLSEHGELNTMSSPDRLVLMVHTHRWPDCGRDTWDEVNARAVINDIPIGYGREAVMVTLDQIIDRMEASVDAAIRAIDGEATHG